MEKFFQANSVVVIGVSNSPGNLGRAMVYNLLEFRYTGCVYLVGREGGAFLGHRIYASVADIPESVELAAVLVPAGVVPSVLRECGERGIKRIVVQSAGFRELGEERMDLEQEVMECLERYQMRMIGPNCIGIINRQNGLAVPFMPFQAEAPPGRVSIVSQSGGVGAMMINGLASEYLGFSKFASIGNKLDVNEADLLEYMMRDEKTDSIFCYLEGIADGRRLMEVACGSSKVVVVHKSNTGRSGSVIARSHSASLSSDDQVVNAAFRQCGILRAQDQGQALQMLKAFMLPPMKGNRLAVISRSGGHAVMAADAAEELGFCLPAFPDDLVQMVEAHSRAKVIQFHNPMDLGDLFDLKLYRTLAEKTLAREDIDGLLFIHNYQGIFDASESRRLIQGLGDIFHHAHKPLAICVFTTRSELEYNRKSSTFPIFTDPREALKALALNRSRQLCSPLPFSAARPSGVDRAKVRQVLPEDATGPLAPDRVAAVLSAYGIPLIDWRHVDREVDAVNAAKDLGLPVVVKTAEPEVIHKSDAGAVHLNLADEKAITSAYRALSSFGPSVLLQKMAEPGLEWFIGGRQDRQFGPVVIVGLGGIYVEVFKESGMRIAPIAEAEANRLLDDVRGAKLLQGIRGEPPLDREALVNTIVRVSWLLTDFPQIQELDLNPVRIYKQGCLAVDWRIIAGTP
ncbi:acetate--CoA ligase family protein [Desulfoferrobacter suflitae]|uniref:acetate--CoA ligase family protein n=1 Tax=Desulfoferrobacter suflitae TaxID=2865782 RepID=UPI002164C4D3|nr:acetate--CoA ligase family protein [Desulfoferrobacter suflitae]MCK8601186.1 acetate--CoA ligase family protein [Desulfoferrobacter suflitae]